MTLSPQPYNIHCDNIFSLGELAAGVANTNAEKGKLSFFINDGKSHTSFLKQGLL